MNELTLVLPDASWKEAILAFRQEFLDANSPLDGTAGLAYCDFEAWLEQNIRNRDPKTVATGLVPASTYLCVRKTDGKLIGMIDIRHTLNAALMQRGGHIGYSIRPCERRKGYAKEQLALALEKCADIGLERVLVTCDKNNLASARTILACHGVLENEICTEEHIIQRYWIPTKQ